MKLFFIVKTLVLLFTLTSCQSTYKYEIMRANVVSFSKQSPPSSNRKRKGKELNIKSCDKSIETNPIGALIKKAEKFGNSPYIYDVVIYEGKHEGKPCYFLIGES